MLGDIIIIDGSDKPLQNMSIRSAQKFIELPLAGGMRARKGIECVVGGCAILRKAFLSSRKPTNHQ